MNIRQQMQQKIESIFQQFDFSIYDFSDCPKEDDNIINVKKYYDYIFAKKDQEIYFIKFFEDEGIITNNLINILQEQLQPIIRFYLQGNIKYNANMLLFCDFKKITDSSVIATQERNANTCRKIFIDIHSETTFQKSLLLIPFLPIGGETESIGNSFCDEIKNILKEDYELLSANDFDPNTYLLSREI